MRVGVWLGRVVVGWWWGEGKGMGWGWGGVGGGLVVCGGGC